MLKISSTRITAGMNTPGHGLSQTLKGSREVANGLTAFKDELCLHFQLQLNTLGVFSVTTDKSIKDWGQHLFECTPKTICERTHTDSLPCFGVGNSHLKFFQVFSTHPLWTEITGFTLSYSRNSLPFPEPEGPLPSSEQHRSRSWSVFYNILTVWSKC